MTLFFEDSSLWKLIVWFWKSPCIIEYLCFCMLVRTKFCSLRFLILFLVHFRNCSQLLWSRYKTISLEYYHEDSSNWNEELMHGYIYSNPTKSGHDKSVSGNVWAGTWSNPSIYHLITWTVFDMNKHVTLWPGLVAHCSIHNCFPNTDRSRF